MNQTRLIIAAIVNRGPISEAQRRAIFAKKRNPQPATGGPRIGPSGSLVMPATPPPAAGSGTVQAGSVAAPTGGLSKTPPPGRNYPANMPPAGMQWAYDAQGNRVAVPINYNFGSGKPITPPHTFPGRPSAPPALIEWFNATQRG